jgi:hypothetical protein
MKTPVNLPQSVHDRIKGKARRDGKPYQEVFYYYAIERFLYRLSCSPYASKFVLKGGLMFSGWGIPLRRPTRDIDLQANLPNVLESLENVVKAIFTQDTPADGMRYDPQSVQGERIITEAVYQGVRIHFRGYLDRAMIQLQIDISFANPITPSHIAIQYPSILGMADFALYGYPIETAIAEKLQAIISLGEINDRMKDFFDIWLLSQEASISGSSLVQAVKATFEARRTNIPEAPSILIDQEFIKRKQLTWERFLKRSNLDQGVYTNFEEILVSLYNFLQPVTRSASSDDAFNFNWTARDCWRPSDSSQ